MRRSAESSSKLHCWIRKIVVAINADRERQFKEVLATGDREKIQEFITEYPKMSEERMKQVLKFNFGPTLKGWAPGLKSMTGMKSETTYTQEEENTIMVETQAWAATHLGLELE